MTPAAVVYCVDTVLVLCYTVSMATWHIIPNSTTNTHQDAVRSIIAHRYKVMFELAGFTVRNLPEHRVGISVSHLKSSAMTLFMLNNQCDGITIQEIS